MMSSPQRARHFVTEVEVDPRRRVSLGKAGKPGHRRYRVEEDDMGVLTLTPVVSVPVTMIADRLRKAVALADAGDLRPRPERSRSQPEDAVPGKDRAPAARRSRTATTRRRA
ncbi:hypothetical protein A5733_08030 [Mycobacterium sp. NS-7484]|uniref:hypothetical protein n=1 Tax=Mycobacterium sp. NS-7484 TaxID=1834161 RepID=UPI00096FE499|nr:hypothetical protein [Mycobacterium sp. NS-7484]OMB98298.1 hypothetical protein A5733_08030 [Mycobacterium sp. NS-7484]